MMPSPTQSSASEGLSYYEVVKTLLRTVVRQDGGSAAAAGSSWELLYAALLSASVEQGFSFDVRFREFELQGYPLSTRLIDATDPSKGAEVVCALTVAGVTREALAPLCGPDQRALATWDAGAVQEARDRAFAKACALHGLGLAQQSPGPPRSLALAPAPAPSSATERKLSVIGQQALDRLKSGDADLAVFRRWLDGDIARKLPEEELKELEKEYDLAAKRKAEQAI